MLNLSDVTLKFHTVNIFVIVDILTVGFFQQIPIL